MRTVFAIKIEPDNYKIALYLFIELACALKGSLVGFCYKD